MNSLGKGQGLPQAVHSHIKTWCLSVCMCLCVRGGLNYMSVCLSVRGGLNYVPFLGKGQRLPQAVHSQKTCCQ